MVCDYFTNWVEAYPAVDHTALTVADKLVNEFFCRFGVLKQIHSDQGPEFKSLLFSTLCDKFEIDKTRTAHYRPQSDGLVERFNRTSIQMLSLFVNSRRSDCMTTFHCY